MLDSAPDTVSYMGVLTIAAVIGDVSGLHPGAIMFAAAGGILGEPAAPPMGVIRKLLVYGASILTGALAGTIISMHYNDGNILLTKWWSLLFTIAFHPLLAVFLKTVPSFATALFATLRRIALAALEGMGGTK